MRKIKSLFLYFSVVYDNSLNDENQQVLDNIKKNNRYLQGILLFPEYQVVIKNH
jgi:hypothetical protein